MVKESAKRLTVLLWMLALMLVAATPALAQGESQYAPEEVVATGVIEEIVEATTFQYGTHALNDGDTGGLLYALISDSVDLDAYEGQTVTVYGTVVPGYESGQVEGGPALLDVYRVEPLDGEGETTTPPAEDSGPVNEANGSGSSNGSVDEAAGREAAGESNSTGSVAERAGVQVLPDTGGAPLMILGAGTLLIAAGLLVRWG